MIQLDYELLLAHTPYRYIDDPVQAQEAGHNHLVDYVRQLSQFPATPGDAGMYDRTLSALPAEDPHLIDLCRQRATDLIDAVAHLHRRRIHIGPGDEFDSDRGAVGRGGRADALDIRQNGQRLLQRQSYVALDLARSR